jgi:hypothetical protein
MLSHLRIWHGVRYHSWLVGLAAVIAAVQLAAYAGLVASMLQSGRTQDFALFYADARSAIIQGQNPYLPTAEETVSGRFVRVNLNPPQFLILLAPLAALDPLPAFIVWTALGAASAAAAIRLILRELALRATRPPALAFIAGVLASAFTGATLLSAQVSWVLWWPVSWAWAAARRGHWTIAGAVLGVVASLKPFLILIAVLLVLARQWRATAMFAVTAGASYLAGLAAFGWETFHAWFTGLGAISWGRSVLNASILGTVERAFGDRRAPVWDLAPLTSAAAVIVPLWLLASAIVLAVSLGSCRRRARHSTSEADAIFAVGLTTALLVSPVGWIYYGMWFAGPVLALGMSEQWWDFGSRRVLLVLFAIPLALAPGMLAAGQPNGWLSVTIGSLYFWSLLSLWLCCVLPLGGRRVQ